MASASYIAEATQKVRLAKASLVEFRDAIVGELEREGGLYPENIPLWKEFNEQVQLLRIWTGHLRKELLDNIPEKSIPWEQVEFGDTVYIDNYQGGKFPEASPRISGPYTVVRGNGCGRCLQTATGRTFMHYPENLITKEAQNVQA